MKSPFGPLQKLFIYERREMAVLTSLCLIMGLFTFTLGIHLGKDVGIRIESSGGSEHKLVTTIKDQMPTNQELVGPNKTTQQALEESLNQSLHDEVVRTGLRLNPAFQTELPDEPKTHNAGATTLKHTTSRNAESHEHTTSQNADIHASEGNRAISSVAESAHDSSTKNPHADGEAYVLQIGSFPKLSEAEKKISELAHLKLQPFMKEVEVKGKGKWFRLYLGGFPTQLAAEKAGKSYIAQHKIQTFIVSKFSN